MQYKIWSPDGTTRHADSPIAAAMLANTIDGATISAAPDASDIEAEYWRRLCILLDVNGIAHAGFVHADDADETVALLAIAERTPAQAARLDELVARRAAIVALIERYNEMLELTPTPADYADEAWWV